MATTAVYGLSQLLNIAEPVIDFRFRIFDGCCGRRFAFITQSRFKGSETPEGERELIEWSAN